MILLLYLQILLAFFFVFLFTVISPLILPIPSISTLHVHIFIAAHLQNKFCFSFVGIDDFPHVYGMAERAYRVMCQSIFSNEGNREGRFDSVLPGAQSIIISGESGAGKVSLPLVAMLTHIHIYICMYVCMNE